ncbi:MAG: hypothetical protein Q7S04_03645 [Candidatus Moranbacteria bacterium]|nr:hypothetical protein [Candidatus Moranbacteria bacterium]
MDKFAIKALKSLAIGLETNSATKDEVKAAAVAVLGLVDPREPYGSALFNALARLTISVCVEMVILRKAADSSQEVLLRKRGADEVYAHQWHAVGSSFRPGDPVAKTSARALRELGNIPLPSPVFRGHFNCLTEERGHYVQLIYAIDATGVEIPTMPGHIEWFSTEALPQDLVENHREVVLPVALGHYDSRDMESFVR